MKMFKFALIILLMLCASLFAQTYIDEGVIDGAEWTKEDGPYRVLGDLEIVDLNIHPGVSVLFMDNWQFEVTGTLTARGFYGDSIYFKPDSNNSNGWGGISFLSASTNSKLSYCKIEAANEHGIFVDQSTPDISNSNLVENDGDGLFLSATQVGLNNCVIKDNADNGVSLNSAELNLKNVIIAGNGQAGIYSSNADDAINLTNVVVADNGSTGVISEAGNIFIKNSIIYYNSTDVALWDDFKTVFYSDIGGSGVFYGTGNLNVTPNFIDRIYYQLSGESPCIDNGKGENDQFFPPSLGTFKNDMGAYGGPGAGLWYPPLYVVPDTLDFRRVTKDSSRSLILTVRNYRDSEIVVNNLSIVGTDADVFTAQPTSFNLNAQESIEINVTFSPTSKTLYSANLSLSTQANGTFSANLHGQGVVPEIVVSDTLLDFGNVSIGDTARLEIYVSNAGEDTLRIDQISSSNPVFVSADTSLKIDPGLDDTLEIAFMPGSAHNYQDSLIIESNDPLRPRLAIALTGAGKGPVIDLARDTLTFESVWLGSDSTLSLLIANPGNIELEIQNLAIITSDSTPGAFRFTDEDIELPLHIDPAGQYELLIVFEPDSIGIDSAQLNIVSNDPIHTLKEVPVSGTGVAPVLSLSHTEMDFGQVPFLSDSIQTVFMRNDGNKILKIEEMQIKHPELQSKTFEFVNPNWILPLNIQPDSSYNLNIRYKPMESNSDSARFIISSNDPLQPQEIIKLSGYCITAQIDLARDALDFGQIASNSESVKYVVVYNLGEGDLIIYADSLAITGAEANAFKVDTLTSDLRIVPGDSAEIVVRAFSDQLGPQNAELELITNDPMNRSLSVALSALIFESQVVQIELDAGHSSTQFISGQNGNLTFSIHSDAMVDSAALFLRLGGKSVFSKKPLSRQEASDFWSAQIESEWVTERGFEYYVCAHYGWTSSIWPENGIQNPKAMQIIVPSLVFPQRTKREIYQKISIPVLTSGQSLSALFEDDLGPYDAKKYRFFDCTDGQNFTELSSLDTDLPPGKALWLVTKEALTLDLDNGFTPSTEQAYSISLKQGWNMIGTPFAFPVSWSDIDAVHPLRYYDGSDWPFVSILEPFKGYAVYVENDTVITIAPNEASASLALHKSSFAIAGEKWQIQLTVEADSLRDQYNFAGACIKAGSKTDRYDYPEPPPIGSYVRLYFVNDNRKQFSTNFHEPGKEGYVFPFEVSNNVNREMTITLFPQSLPEDYDWLVLAPESGLKYAEEVINCGNKRTKYQLVVGTEKFLAEISKTFIAIPKDFSLSQNYPNPFNPVTLVTFQIPGATRITLDVFNILGQRLKTLISNQRLQPGYYTVQWDGTNDIGKKVAAGVYFLQLRSNHYHKTIKMIMQK